MRRPEEELAPALFAAGLALAALFHQAAESAWIASPSDGVLTAAAFWSLLAPGSFVRLGLLAAAQVADVAVELPFVSNHWLLLGFVSLGVLAAIGAPDPGRTYGPVARSVLLLLYALAFFHKLNRDYFDPATSCATEIVQGWARVAPLPSSALVDGLAIYGSLALEAAIPLLLLAGRGGATALGIALGVAFHVALAVYPDNRFYNFSAVVIAGYLAFVPAQATIARHLRAWIERGDGRLHRATVAATALVVLAGTATIAPATADASARVLWIVLAIAVLALVLGDVRRSPGRVRPLLLPDRRIALAIPLLVLVNGASPYLGGKTETSFAMYSNLRTEGRSNHLLIPGKVTGAWQDDWVTILDSEDPLLAALARSGKSLVRFQLASLLAERPPAASTIDYQGARHAWRSDESPPSFLAAPPRWARKLFYFRPIEAEATKVACGH